MIADLFRRFDPDSGKMLLCGFSGGARYSPIYSHKKLNVGVIACGAGMSPLGGTEQLNLPFYTGIAGRLDMLYLEVNEAVEQAWKNGTRQVLYSLTVWSLTGSGPACLCILTPC